MGAWGVGSFDNDTACDWAYDLQGMEDLSFVEETLDAVLQAVEYLEAPEAEMAVAAAEVLARLRGNPAEKDAYTEKVDRWVESHPDTPPKSLIDKALKSLDRIQADNSELNELWEESDEFAAWQGAVDDLRRRLTA